MSFPGSQGLDAGSQFTLGLLQSIGSQIQEGKAKAQDQQVLNELMPQLQQAQNPQDILNLITQAQVEPNLSQQAKQGFVQAATPAFNLAREQLKKRDDLSDRKGKLDMESDQKLGLADMIRQAGGKITDEQALRVPLKSLESQFDKQLQLGKEKKSKVFKENSTFANKLFEEERKSFEQTRLVKQAKEASANFNAAAGALGRAFPAVKGEAQAVFDTSVGLLIENFTKLFPGRISDVKFKFLQTLLPLASQRQDVRDAILGVLEDLAATPALSAEVQRNLQSQNPDILEDANMQNLLNQELGIKFNEIDSKLDALNQFQDLEGSQQDADVLSDPRVADIVSALRAQGVSDEDIRRGLSQ